MDGWMDGWMDLEQPMDNDQLTLSMIAGVLGASTRIEKSFAR
jgi:hypothetical protein